MAAKSLLTGSAQRALAAAVTVSGIEGDEASYAASIDLVRETAKRYLDGTFVENSSVSLFGVDVAVPPPGNDQARQLLETPIEISIRGQFSPILPLLPSLRLHGLAVGFREPRTEVSLTTPTDCIGRKIGHPHYQAGCPCSDPRATRDSETRQCQCPNKMLLQPDGSCGCAPDASGRDLVRPTNYYQPEGWDTPMHWECRCNGKGFYLDGETNECKCGIAYQGDNCEECAPGYTRSEYQDRCRACPNYDEVVHDCLAQGGTLRSHGVGNDCSCRLPNETCSNECYQDPHATVNQDCQCQCAYPYLWIEGVRACVCQLTNDDCVPNEYPDMSTCECKPQSEEDEYLEPTCLNPAECEHETGNGG